MEKKSLTLSMTTESHAESNKNSETHLHTMVYLSKKFSVITEILLRQVFFCQGTKKMNKPDCSMKITVFYSYTFNLYRLLLIMLSKTLKEKQLND